jgi:hypothetical protein
VEHSRSLGDDRAVGARRGKAAWWKGPAAGLSMCPFARGDATRRGSQREGKPHRFALPKATGKRLVVGPFRPVHRPRLEGARGWMGTWGEAVHE